ncbi:hypothetical protein TIFTF001_028600 [Ficus carica]|uniref:Uncharacterized protein n=1 Tax=Ficus carica TaxID=3494 RepID=A0AA88DQN9_FICCA|nr:hypothetical protein TIFTF001_028600 [Ficus carica]
MVAISLTRRLFRHPDHRLARLGHRSKAFNKLSSIAQYPSSSYSHSSSPSSTVVVVSIRLRPLSSVFSATYKTTPAIHLPMQVRILFALFMDGERDADTGQHAKHGALRPITSYKL